MVQYRQTNKQISSVYQIELCFRNEVCAYAFTYVSHKPISNKIPTNESLLSTIFLQNKNKMTKTCAKIGGRETLKDGIISKVQRHIVSQRNLLIVIHLFSSRFMTYDYWTLLCCRLTFTCVSEPRTPPCRFLHV